MSKTAKRAIVFSAMGLIFAVVLAANVVAGVFSGLINDFLYSKVSSGITQETMQKGEKLCEEIESEGIVMLKNEDGALPIKDTKKLNVFGWSATDAGFIISGSGSGSSDERTEFEKQKLLKGLTAGGFEYNQSLIDMYESYKDERDGSSLNSAASLFFRLIEPDQSYYTAALMDEAKLYSDTALIVIGRLGGEGKDLPTVQYKYKQAQDNARHYLELSLEEEALVNLVTQNFDRVIVVLNSCNAMELGFLENNGIDAAISVGGPGQAGTPAIGKLLAGTYAPSGRTADTYVYDLESDPAYVNAGGQGVTGYKNGDNYVDYAEGVYVGYRYYETAAFENYLNYDNTVQYPFGYGLSYTTFKQEIIKCEPQPGSKIDAGTEFRITVKVANTGEVKSKEAVQLYFTAPYYKGIEKPYVQLVAFDKTVELKSGESQEIVLSFDAYQLASYDCYDRNANGFAGYELEHGDYLIKLQSDSHTPLEGENNTVTYTVENDVKYEKDPVSGEAVVNRFTGDTAYAGVSIDGRDSGADIKYMSRKDFAGTFPRAKAAARAKAAEISAVQTKYMPTAYDTDTAPVQGASGSLRLTTGDGKAYNDELMQQLGKNYDDPLWEDLLNQLKVGELNKLVEMAGYQTFGAESIGKPKCVDLDGPSGLNQVNFSDADSSWVCYPVESVIACTFNPRLAYTFGLAVGYEASETNVSGWYAPAVNIHRNPFDGRNYEYYSEDPYLSGVLGAETVRGATANGLYCYIKHFAVNETETGREGLFTWLDEQTLREIYLRPFEIAVKRGGANAVMSSFNRLGAVWTGGNYALLTEVLRGEWGFRGSVVTDWTTGGGYMNVDQGIRAGNDCWLTGLQAAPGGHDDKTSPTAVSCARRAAKNMLYTYCNTYYVAQNHDSSQDQFVAETSGVKSAADHFPTWIFAIVALDLVTLAGLSVWLYFTLRKKKPAAAEKSLLSDGDKK